MNITNYKPINKNTLIAAFDLAMPSGICIYGALYHVKDGSAWIAFPGRPYQKDGATTYAKLVDIPDRATRDKFNATVIGALKAGGFV